MEDNNEDLPDPTFPTIATNDPLGTSIPNKYFTFSPFSYLYIYIG